MNEQNQRNQEIHQENRRARRVFVLVIVANFAVGLGAGVLGLNAAEGKQALQAGLQHVLLLIAPYAVLGGAILFEGAATLLFCRAKAHAQRFLQDPAQEDALAQAEKQLDLPMVLNSCGLVVNYFFFSVAVTRMGQLAFWQLPFVLGSFALAIAWGVILQQKVVDLEKLLNPEKRGSVYDIHFARKWEDSCDEAQKLAIYRAAYSAYKAANGACTALWCILTPSGLFLDTGLLPVLVVVILWLTLIVSYSVACVKMEHGAMLVQA